MSRRERVQAAIRRQPVDRVPYAVWRHFPTVDRSPAALAQATLRFHDHYGSDFLKITPRAGYPAEPWGCVEADEVLPGGNRPCASHGVTTAEDWGRVRAVDPITAPGYTEQLETIIRIGFDRRIGDAPVLPTVFSPLSIARKLAGDRLTLDLRDHPSAVTGALDAITETQIRFAEAALAEGVSGIFYSIQTARHNVMSEDLYAQFGEPYDQQVLRAIRDRSTVTVVHCHGDALMFDRLARLPGDIWNWEDRATPPSLAGGARLVAGAVCGGLDQTRTLLAGAPAEAATQALEAVKETGGTGLVIGPGCVLLMDTPDANIAAVVHALGGPLKPIPGVRR